MFATSSPFMDIAVIGAGVTGLTTALSLQMAGHRVTLFDKHPFPTENTSAIAGGMLAPFSESEILPRLYVEAGLRGIDLWKQLLGEAYRDCLYENGSLVLGTDAHRPEFEAFAASLTDGPKTWSWLDREAIRQLEPDLAHPFDSGILLPGEAHLLPDRSLAVLFERFLQLEGKFRVRCAKPEELVLQYDRVIDCRGYVPGVDDDLFAVQGEIVVIHHADIRLCRPVRIIRPDTPFYIVPRPGGELAVGATAIAHADETEWRVRVSSAMTLLGFAIDMIPGLESARIVALHSGLRAAYPSLLPEIRSSHDGRIVHLNGLYRHGYLLSPVMAACVVRMMRGEEDIHANLFSGRLNVPPIRLDNDAGGTALPAP
jgi:glycine oxidase